MYQPTIYDLADLQLMQQPNPFAVAAAQMAEAKKEMLMHQMAAQQTQQIHGALEAQHMRMARENALAELGVRDQMQRSEDTARSGREQTKLSADARKALDQAMGVHGIARNGGESDDEFRARGYGEIRKNNKNEISSYDRGIDSLTKQIVRIASAAEADRSAKIERAAREAIGLNDKNSAVELTKPSVLNSLALQREMLEKTTPHDSAVAAELASLKNEHARLTQAREKALEKYSSVGGAMTDLYAPPALPNARERLPLPSPPPGANKEQIGPPPPSPNSGVSDYLSGLGALKTPSAGLQRFFNAISGIGALTGRPNASSSSGMNPEQSAIFQNNQMLYGNPNGIAGPGMPGMPVPPVLSSDPSGGYSPMNSPDLSSLGQLPITAPPPDALQPSVNVFPRYPFGQ